LCYGILIAVISVINHFGADRWWFGAFNAYLPQAIWLVPGIVLTLCGLVAARRWVWLPLLMLVWVAGPVMGFCWSSHSSAETAGTGAFRVMTCNAKYGKFDPGILVEEFVKYRPDVILLQDAGGSLVGPIGDFLRKWNVRTYSQYVVASRFPINEGEPWITIPKQNQPGLRCRVRVGGTNVTIYNVHFESPRDGLNAFRSARHRPRFLPRAAKLIEINAEDRLTQALAIRELVRAEKGPVIVAGDLNSTDASVACSMLRDAGLHDAFAEAGRGYGYTYGHLLLRNRIPWLHASWMRIDHIMMSRRLRADRCWTGTGRASEHRPVFADLVLQ
jgi:endonuclease/exonuclease/phosphatase family metal-dependent hydrolase